MSPTHPTQSCIAACDEALATQATTAPSPTKPSGGLMGPPPSPGPRANRAQALFWRARARAASAAPVAIEGLEGQEEGRQYVMGLALKDLGEAVRLEPGDRAIRWVVLWLL